MTGLADRDDDDLSCGVFRSQVDGRVWMCNIPVVDVATGLQASTSLALIKAYVEDVADRMLNIQQGEWVQGHEDGETFWTYRETEES